MRQLLKIVQQVRGSYLHLISLLHTYAIVLEGNKFSASLGIHDEMNLNAQLKEVQGVEQRNTQLSTGANIVN